MDKFVIISIPAESLNCDLLRNVDPISNGINIVQEPLPVIHRHISVKFG